jgi:hypothetical protein
MFCPEDFGPIGTSADARAINAAVAAAQAAGGGMVVLSQPYAVEATISVGAGPAVSFWCLGAGNRQVNPDIATGGSVRPADGFPSHAPLFSIGTSSERCANPCGTTFLMPRITGRSPRGTLVEGCTGILVTDTADVHLIEPFLADFDRKGETGTAVHLAGSEPMSGPGFCVTGGIISSSWRGIYGDGAGVTDVRLSGLLEHSNTFGITVGATAGGGGLQMSGCHLVYANGPRGGWRLAVGPAAGDFIVTGNYFDKNGPSPAVVLANARGKVSENHFLADPSCDGPMVTVTAARPSLTFRGNECRANGSPMTALLQFAGGSAGAPPNGVYEGNNVYGTHPGLIAPLIDRRGAPVKPVSTASTYVAGNVVGD